MATKPTPIPSRRISDVHKTIAYMQSKQERLTKQPFTTSELLQLFVDPDHHSLLVDSYQLCEPTGREYELFVRREVVPEHGGGVAHIRFYWSGLSLSNGFYVPHRVGSSIDFPATVRPEAPAELVERFEQVADDLIGIRYRFDQVIKVLDVLNQPKVCRSLAQMRYHWPCIVTILRKANCHDLADSVSEPNARAGGEAVIPANTRRLLAETNRTITSHVLIDDIPDSDTPLPIQYDLRKR